VVGRGTFALDHPEQLIDFAWRPAGRGFTLVGPIAPEGTRGNSSEGYFVGTRAFSSSNPFKTT
jgi:hypothetical protein